MLGIVQMSKFAKRKPHQLSGGQQQRVALARSLAKSPKLLLLDEPMGALDKKLRSQMQLELANIIERLGVTCVMVTHDQEEAMTMATADRDHGQRPHPADRHADEIYEQPANRFTAEFIGSVNLFEGSIEEDEKDYATIRSPALESDPHRPRPDRLRRPEGVLLAAPGEDRGGKEEPPAASTRRAAASRTSPISAATASTTCACPRAEGAGQLRQQPALGVGALHLERRGLAVLGRQRGRGADGMNGARCGAGCRARAGW
jgi:ABC-type proline/glycine betaine transport system ATPase subunit